MKEILFSSLLKDNEKYIPYMFKIFQQIEKNLSDKYIFKYLIYTNDNTDNTLQLLKKYSGKNFEIISENLDEKMLSMGRVERLRHLREKILKKIREKKFDYLFLYDSDIYFNSSIIESLISNLNTSDYEAVVPNTLNQTNFFYYDLFSLKGTDKKPIGIDNYPRLLKFHKDCITKKKFEVESAFGGLFLTSYEKIKDSKISYLDAENIKKECEHVTFNKNFKLGFIADVTPIRLKKDKDSKHKQLYEIISKNKKDNRKIFFEISMCAILILILLFSLYTIIFVKKFIYFIPAGLSVFIFLNYIDEFI